MAVNPPMPPRVVPRADDAVVRPARQGRTRIWALTMVSLLAAGVAAVFANVLATQGGGGSGGRRWDLSAAGDQSLSPRTLRVLGLLNEPYRIVIAAERATLDPRARQAVGDVLNELTHASPRIQRTEIDTGSGAGQTQYASLINDLAQRDAATLAEQSKQVETAAGAAAALDAWLTRTLSPELLRVREVAPGGSAMLDANRQYLQTTAASARILGRDLTNAATNARAALKADVAGVPVPDTARAAKLLADALTPAAEQLGSLAKELRRYAGPERVGEWAERAGALVKPIEQQRDAAAVALEGLKRMPRPDLVRVNEVLKAGQAALIVGPPAKAGGAGGGAGGGGGGIAAMDLESLFGAGGLAGTPGTDAAVDLRRRAEDMISSSLAMLLSPNRPIVVLVQASPRRLFETTPIPYFDALVRRLSVRGIDMIEWAVSVDPAPPRLAELNPLNARPVVYAVLSPDSSSEGDKAGNLTGSQQVAKLGEVLRLLADQGANLLVSLNPSVLPTYNEADPIADVLGKWGLSADTGRPLLTEQLTTKGRVVATDASLLPVVTPTASNPIPSAIAGLPTYFSWPVPILRRYDPALRMKDTIDLYTIPVSDATWAESQWLRVWQTPPEQRAFIADAPKFDQGRDLRSPPGTGVVPVDRWAVATAAERVVNDGKSQRVVAVGSNSWFVDQIAQQQQDVGGRAVSVYPGNMELFEASVLWLAGRDELIAQSPTAKQVSLIAPIEASRLFWLRAAAIAGVPGAVLALGALVRLLRG